MRGQDIEVGKVYVEQDGTCRYVIEMLPGEGRKMPRVTWRRIGKFADKTVSETLNAFVAEVVVETNEERVDPAPALPNDGMAVPS